MFRMFKRGPTIDEGVPQQQDNDNYENYESEAQESREDTTTTEENNANLASSQPESQEESHDQQEGDTQSENLELQKAESLTFKDSVGFLNYYRCFVTKDKSIELADGYEKASSLYDELSDSEKWEYRRMAFTINSGDRERTFHFSHRNLREDRLDQTTTSGSDGDEARNFRGAAADYWCQDWTAASGTQQYQGFQQYWNRHQYDNYNMAPQTAMAMARRGYRHQQHQRPDMEAVRQMFVSPEEQPRFKPRIAPFRPIVRGFGQSRLRHKRF